MVVTGAGLCVSRHTRERVVLHPSVTNETSPRSQGFHEAVHFCDTIFESVCRSLGTPSDHAHACTWLLDGWPVIVLTTISRGEVVEEPPPKRALTSWRRTCTVVLFWGSQLDWAPQNAGAGCRGGGQWEAWRAGHEGTITGQGTMRTPCVCWCVRRRLPQRRGGPLVQGSEGGHGWVRRGPPSVAECRCSTVRRNAGVSRHAESHCAHAQVCGVLGHFWGRSTLQRCGMPRMPGLRRRNAGIWGSAECRNAGVPRVARPWPHQGSGRGRRHRQHDR